MFFPLFDIVAVVFFVAEMDYEFEPIMLNNIQGLLFLLMMQKWYCHKLTLRLSYLELKKWKG